MDFIRRTLTRWVSFLIRKDLVDSSSIQFTFVDPLTQLANRQATIDRLRAARRDGITGVIAYCDLDGFKMVNDRLGHDVGDEVLREVGRRLRRILPQDAWLARFGGDEFGMFLPHAEIGEAMHLLEHCLEAVRRPIRMNDGADFSISMSVGLAPFSGGGIEDTLRAADIAMFAAKCRGRDCVVVFSEDAQGILAGRRELAAAIITLQERNRALQEASRTDALTRLGNRLALDEILPAVVGGRDLPYQGVAVTFVDVDHFGKYNRCYGDPGGDDVLRRLGEAFRASARQHDMVFRKGGEEFVIVMSDVDLAAARGAAERIRAFVEGLAIPHAGSDTAPVLTVTLGVARGGPGTTALDLMVAASKLATAAKNSGQRNQVHAESIV